MAEIGQSLAVIPHHHHHHHQEPSSPINLYPPFLAIGILSSPCTANFRPTQLSYLPDLTFHHDFLPLLILLITSHSVSGPDIRVARVGINLSKNKTKNLLISHYKVSEFVLVVLFPLSLLCVKRVYTCSVWSEWWELHPTHVALPPSQHNNRYTSICRLWWISALSKIVGTSPQKDLSVRTRCALIQVVIQLWWDAKMFCTHEQEPGM